ncbi:MAG: thiamine biosynthesis protein ThiS [Candidatus Wallbacteria bacterium HGW-Wallbacteria-1]|jgi:thiamine biosynthesis protein ThiS|uniref:Thiamine biosynthesis protein ThiS n=1 Tax=Candidatus Wallbacteria bacterium HGW-Wallbacteria-1 TaxID=2013854 RepID=A0A2N1PHH7_9BACT|nr:MAG: thiamine biosynthesis protein ThiS [Candidatus Wallbacteria bacterium HGW-Wallbacteria-1]PKM48416.1 MAG: thiamine biosynthesis protein ThiS [Firmicutes bacterium HGW-Firmicutes-6]
MRVNGKEMTLGNSQSLLQFLEINQFDVATLAVARNGEIVPKATYNVVMLGEEDILEVVRFVGGG